MLSAVGLVELPAFFYCPGCNAYGGGLASHSLAPQYRAAGCGTGRLVGLGVSIHYKISFNCRVFNTVTGWKRSDAIYCSML